MLKHVLLKVAVASFTFSIFARGGGGDFFLFLIMMAIIAFMPFFVVDMFRGFGVLASLLRTVMALIAGIVSGFFFMLLGTGIGGLFIAAFVAAVVSEFVCSSWAKQEPSELQEKQEVQE